MVIHMMNTVCTQPKTFFLLLSVRLRVSTLRKSGVRSGEMEDMSTGDQPREVGIGK
jgi:hypothetical protein